VIEVEAPLLERAAGLVSRAAESGVAARLFGGVAVSTLLGERWPEACRRPPGDIDLAAPGNQRRQLARVILDSGFKPDREFNALHGGERLLFHDGAGVRVDVVLGVLRMCHEIPLDAAFEVPGATLPAWLLLVSKLQVVELTEKDRLDAAALLAACEVQDLEAGRIARLCSDNWGLWRTLTGTLAAIGADPPELPATLADRLQTACRQLAASMQAEPKSMRWRLRARLGERVRWYELPESP
jgi:hypothetical protein